jgi:hypothetical protein
MNLRNLSIIAVIAGAVFYVAKIRPWARFWGATEDELRRPLPDETIVANPRYQSRRAITINAPADEVWAWLVQLGQGRGGFYSYDWLENLFGLNIHSVDEIRPDLQELSEGDFIAAEPKHVAGWTVTSYDRPKTLLLTVSAREDASEDGVESPFSNLPGLWTFLIDPIDETSCRLVADFRADLGSGVMPAVLTHALLEPAHFVMERGMLIGIKQRAEARFAEKSESPRSA